MPGNRVALQVRFETAEDFRKEYTSNISRGGIFVPTREPIEVHAAVRVVLDLVYRGERAALNGEVVNRVPPELAHNGGTPGVAVQFEISPQRLEEQLAAFGPFTARAAESSEARGAERRVAPRAPVRVPVQLKLADPAAPGPDASSRVRTRDLSTVGVLLGIEGEPQPIGARVQVSISHPTTGEHRAIAGQVARHVTDEQGRVTAIGVAFVPSALERPAVVAHLQSVLSAEHSRRLGGIYGTLDAVDLPALIQSLSRSSEGGTLTLSRGAEEGWVVISKGWIHEVRLGEVSGLKALARLLSWSEGYFEFHVLAELPEGQGSLHLDRAVLEALEHVNALSSSGCPAPDLCPAIDRAAAEHHAAELGKLEHSVLDLAATGMPLGRILDVVPEPDAAIYRALEDLRERGIVELG